MNVEPGQRVGIRRCVGRQAKVTEVRKVTAATDVARYRARIAKLLAKSVMMARELEGQLGTWGGEREENVQIDFDDDPWRAYRITCALLLRKAGLHAVAVLRAHEISNLHSLAVQMRPVLECAGQVVFIFHSLIVAPKLANEGKRAADIFHDYVNADYYQTFISATMGEDRHKELLKTIWKTEDAAAAKAGAKPRPDADKRKGRGLKQTDRVAMLSGGIHWYNHLSEYFCHARGELREATWRGGVVSTATVRDELAFAGFMDYLAEQVAVMNTYAALCPVADDDGHSWVDATLAQLREVREESKAMRAPVVSAFSKVSTAPGR